VIDEVHIPTLQISKIDKLQNILNTKVDRSVLSNYQPLITAENKLPYSLISGTPDLSLYLLKEGGVITGNLTVMGKLIPKTFVVPTSIPANLSVDEWGMYLDEDGVGSELPTGGNLDEDKLWALLASVNNKYVINSSHIPSLEISKVNNLQNLLNSKADIGVFNNYLSLEGGTMKGNIKLLPGNSFISKSTDNTAIFGYTASEVLVGANNSALSLRSNGIATINNNQIIHAGNISSQSVSYATSAGNADSATKLQTARTIWGQSFDGTANVSGNISGTYFHIEDRASNPYFKLIDREGQIGYVQLLPFNKGVAIGSIESKSLIVNPSGNVLIGTTEDRGYTLQVNGTFNAGSSTLASLAVTNNAKINGEMDANALVIPTAPPANPQAGKHYLYMA
jgi:hypothetical protein